MIRRLSMRLIVLLALSAVPAAAQPGKPSDTQYWMGAMDTGTPANPTLLFLVTIWQEGGPWRGTLDIPPSIGIGGAWAAEFLSVDVAPDHIELVQPASRPDAPPNIFSMVRNPTGGDVASGKVLIGGSAEIEARMWKVSSDEARDFMPRRPQFPKPPLPYEQRRVQVPNTRGGEKVELVGILTIPAGAGPHPAIVLVNALDVFDADHSSMGHKPFFVLADRLARAGIATLRTQDRPLRQAGLAPQTQVTVEQLGAEAGERAAWLAGQPGIDGGRIGLLGLNEGGTAAAVAAVQAGTAVRCLVMLAPLAVNGLEQVRGEFAEAVRKEGETQQFIDRRTASFIKQYELLAAGASDQQVIDAIDAEMSMQRTARRQQLGEASAEVIRNFAQQQYLIINTDAFRRGLTFDPAEVLSRVPQPALAILGGKDARFIASKNVPAIEASLGKRVGVETVIRVGANLNHRLQPAISGNMLEIQELELTFDEGVLKDTVEFLIRQLKPSVATKEDSK